MATRSSCCRPNVCSAEANLATTLETENHASRKARRERQLEAEIEALKARLRKKDEVMDMVLSCKFGT